VLYLEPGGLVTADGVFIAGHNVRCDESSVTGESVQKKKTPGREAMAQIEAETSMDKLDDLDPFTTSGSKVLKGVGTYLVTGVGMNSSYGKLIMAMTDDADVSPTPL
jgi:P-type Ca2+ transporter type 2C